jgi:RNA polymerase sigma-70 factor, ECF subfamily
MNISGHETEGAPHMSEEQARVEDLPILEALARSDREAAANLLVEQHARAIGRVCLALIGSQSEAEEALQETLLCALDGLEQYRGDGSLRAWLLSIARRRSARRVEARTRDRELAQKLPAPEPAPSAEQLSLARRARQLLSEVRPTEREALVLRYAAELSFREVAQASGIDEATARKRVSRGLARLRSLLGEDKS